MRTNGASSQDNQGRRPAIHTLSLPLLLVPVPPEPPELPITLGYEPGFDGMGRG